MTSTLLAHQGGWDEILMVLVPIALFAGLLAIANRRAASIERAADTGETGDPSDAGAPAAPDDTGDAGDPGDPGEAGAGRSDGRRDGEPA